MNGDFYGLDCPPFEDDADRRFYFPSLDHEAALHLMQQAVGTDQGPVLLTGDAGTGKTLLCLLLMSRQRRGRLCLMHTCKPGDSRGLIVRVCEALDGNDPPAGIATGELDRLQRLIVGRPNGRKTGLLLVLDDVENLSAQDFEELALVLGLHQEGKPLVRGVLSGRPEVLPAMRHPALDPLQQCLGGMHRLQPLARAEVAPYVMHRLRLAGATGQAEGNGCSPGGPVFDDEALEVVAELSGGVPRRINNVCSAALRAGRALRRRPIDRALMVDLDLHSRTARATASAESAPAEQEAVEAVASPSADDPRDVVPRHAESVSLVNIERAEAVAARMEALLAELPAATTELRALLGVAGEKRQQFSSLIAASQAAARQTTGAVQEAQAAADRLTRMTVGTAGPTRPDSRRDAGPVGTAGKAPPPLGHGSEIASQPPSETLETARQILAEVTTQSARLQDICGVVRKATAALASATLRAGERIKQLREIEEAVRLRSANLAAATRQASSMLQTWVGEARQVQSRLAESLERCPSIVQTHPPELLDALTISRPDASEWPDQEPLEPLAYPSRVEPTGANAPAAAHVGTPDLGRVRTRTAEVQKLLEDARRFAEREAEKRRSMPDRLRQPVPFEAQHA